MVLGLQASLGEGRNNGSYSGGPGGSRGVRGGCPGGSRGVLGGLPVGSRAELGESRAQRGIPVNRCRPKCAENLVKHNENEQSKMAHGGLWGEYFGTTWGPKYSPQSPA